MANDLLYPQTAIADPEVGWAVERSFQQLLNVLLHELVTAGEEQADERRPISSARIVRRATDLVLADPTSRVGLVDICAALGVSLRTLHYAFGDVTEMTAATWLRRIRLNRVHKDLAVSSSNEVRIKSVATRHGFVHLGHFSEQYRRLFGRLPSETLNSG